MDNSAPVGDSVAGGGKQHGLRNFIKKRLAKAGKRLHVPGAGGGPRLDRDSVDPVVRASRASKAKSRRFARELNKTPPVGAGASRTVQLDGGRPAEGFPTNDIKTAKYNPATFLPKFLWEMFSRAAYLYFLFQAALSWWSEVSPYSGWGSTLALLFVLVVAGIKALWEDRKRHQEDRETNNSVTHVMQPDGSFADITWRDVKVGQVVRVLDNELFPADLVCLHSGLPDKVAFIKTTNLDGESNLKIRSTLNMAAAPADAAGWTSVRGTLQCEPPNADLHVFKGRFDLAPSSALPASSNGAATHTVPVTMNEMLLRGCTLKNTGEILGLVVYSGAETRIQQNSAETPLKYGSFDKFLNVQITLIIVLQIVMCALHGSLALWWRNQHADNRYYLATTVQGQGNYTSNVAQWFIYFLTFWILYSYLVPISLFVTMELVKFWQGFVFINSDESMVDDSGKHAKARNTNLNEDLGKVSYVFSDKTGTLTSNEMQLRQIAIRGITYGSPQYRLEDRPELHGPAALEQWDQRLAAADDALAEDQLEFWTNICLCHSLIVEPNPAGGLPVYQGPSPDEVALAEGARQLGFEFVSRSSNGIVLNLQGTEVRYEVLNVLEYSSARARMSVIVRLPDGGIQMFCKGADAKVMEMVRGTTDPKLFSATEENLHEFAVNGLRTLVVATKEIPEDVWAEWDAGYQAAASDLDNRDEKLAAAAEVVEKDLQLTGITAIEDKLQAGVPATIETLLMAGIKVWVITGDKQETAINIAISCKLILHPDRLMICNAEDYDSAKARVLELLQFVRGYDREKAGSRPELVIDGRTLGFVLGHDTEAALAELGSHCGAVVICRASPSQKAAIVSMMDEFELRRAGGRRKGWLGWYNRIFYGLKGKMLAIGDGANDVAMIQAAQIGVGIMGKEGRQAVNNSDYAIGQFRFLARLLLVHGSLSHYRLARLIKYSFYKNILFCFVLFFFQFYCGFSGQALVDSVTAAAYNVIFTSVPILIFAVVDRPVQHFETLIRYPQMYNRSGMSSLSSAVFWRYAVLTAIVTGAACLFIPYYAIVIADRNSVDDLYSVGKIVIIVVVLVVNVEVALTARYWTTLFVVFVVLSYACTYAFMLVYMWIIVAGSSEDPAQYGVIYRIMADSQLWLLQIVVVLLTMLYRNFDRMVVWLLSPHDDMLLVESEKQLGNPLANLDQSEATRLAELRVLPGSGTYGMARTENGLNGQQQQHIQMV